MTDFFSSQFGSYMIRLNQTLKILLLKFNVVKYIITFFGTKFQFIICHLSIIYHNSSDAKEYICYKYFF